MKKFKLCQKLHGGNSLQLCQEANGGKIYISGTVYYYVRKLNGEKSLQLCQEVKCWKQITVMSGSQMVEKLTMRQFTTMLGS